MKIYEIGTGYTPIPAQMGAATEIVVEELTKSFRKMGVPVEIIDIAAETRGYNDLPIREVWVPSCFSGTDVKLGLMHKLKRVVYSVCLAGTLGQRLRKETEKVVLHFHNQYNLFFFLKLTSRKLRRKAVIAYTNHSGVWRQDWSVIEETIRKRYFQEAECMKKADLVFLLNETTKENAIKHIAVPEDRIVLVGNGVNTDIYHPLPEEEKLAAKRKWKLSDRKVILQVGSVNENKGQLRALEYLLPLLKQHPELVYVYAGGIIDPQYQKRICGFVQEHDLQQQVRYLGMLVPGEELNAVYNCADATIFPSIFEAFGLVAVESAAAGIPVFLDQKGMVQFERGVIFYECGRFSEIAEDYLYGNACDTKKVRIEARNFAIEQYSWDKIARDYYTAFENRMKTNG